MLKKIGVGFLILVAVALIWYLFIKPSDYIINFKVVTTPGTVTQSVKSWNYDVPDSEIIAQDGLNKVVQQRHFGDSVVNYSYEAKMINDSVTQVSVGVKDLDHSVVTTLKLMM